jgi:phenylalanyl-tRNA synthetase beta subunit
MSLRQVGLGQLEKTIPSLSQICKGLLLSQRHQQKAKRKLQKMDLKEVENLYIQNLYKAMKLALSLIM